MKTLWILCLLITCSFSVAFGQLRVANNSGKNLRVAVGGQTQAIAYKNVTIYNVREKQASLDCLDPVTNTRFVLVKKVPRNGYITIEPSDYPQPAVVQTVQTFQTQAVSYDNQASNNGASLSSVMSGAAVPSSSQKTVTTIVTDQKGVNQTQTQQYLERVLVIYDGFPRFKVFSDIGGSRWQGIEFRGKETTDSIKDNAKNQYYLLAQKDQDVHIGVIFNPSGAINEYGEFRKRLNKEDDTLYINDGEIKKMSTSETKMIKVKFMARGYKIYFEPKPEMRGNNDPISLKYNQRSRPFSAPIGQFYLKVSCTDARGMFHPSLFIPLHVTSGDNYVEITTQDVDKAINADINLNWNSLYFKK